MTWTIPKTWNTGDPLLAADMNTYIRDNLAFLKDPPFALHSFNEAGDYSTSSLTFVEVDSSGTELTLTITTAGGDVAIGFFGTFSHSAANGRCMLDVDINGTMLGGDSGLAQFRSPGAGSGFAFSVSFVAFKSGLAPGSHTFKLMWATSGATLTLYAGAGTSTFDHHPQFWVREL
jgi:hypothetical protein